LPSSLSGLHPRKVPHALQAEIVLATYFFSAGKFTEGMYHTAAAVSLAMSSGLHKICAEAPSLVSSASMNSEEGQRFEACWATLALDKAWAVALGAHSNWNDTLDTPWPLDINVSITVTSPSILLTQAVFLWERANSFGARWNLGSD
jgi:hypothetical protein